MKTIDIFPWNDHFKTGIEIIDTQHQQLVTLLNRLATQVAYQSSAEELNSIFDELASYTVYHFQTEEAIWKQHLNDDPLDTEHQKIHQKFIDTIVALKKQLEIKSLSELAHEALDFLAKWLVSHILETDRYMAYVVIGLENGLDIDVAKEVAEEKMNGASKILVDIILSIYSTLSSNTLQLMQELQIHQQHEQKITYQDKYLQLLLELSSSFINLPLDQIDSKINKALKEMAIFANADRAYIFDYDFDAKTTTNTYEWCADGIEPQIDDLQNLPIECVMDWPEIHAKGRYVLIQDVKALDPGDLRDLLLPQSIQSLVTFPLFEGDCCIGFVGFDAVRNLHTFSEIEIELLSFFSKLLSNIANRKTIETQLQYERSFFKTLVQEIPDLIWLKDIDGIYLACNNRFEDFFGAKEAEIVGKTDYDFVEKALADFFRENDNKTLHSNKPNFNEEEVSFASDGHKEILHTTKLPMRDSNGGLIGILGVARDITKIKNIQDKLAEKEHYQRALLDNFPFPIWLKDDQSRFLAVNQAFADSCNMNLPDALVGKTDLDVWPKELAQAYREDDKDVLLSGKPKNVEEPFVVNESTILVETYKSPVVIDENTIGTVGFARDITIKKELEKNLILERNRLERYLHTVEAIIVSIDESGMITLVNRKGCDLLGYTQEELLGQQWFKFCLPQPQGMDETYPVFLEIMNGNIGGFEYFENEILTKGGQKKLIAWHNSYLSDENGSIIGTLSAGEDITQSRELEKKLRLAASVFTHSSEGIIITSLENKIIEINHSVERMTGYSRDELIGKDPKILSSGEQKPFFYENMWKELHSNGSWTGEVINRKKNGETFTEMLTISSVKDDDNNLIHYVGLFSDISILKEQQKHLEYIAHYDALTGLPNRVLLSDRLQQAMVFTRRNHSSIAIVYLDLDGFKEVNDTYGHDVGDKLLTIVANRMKISLREGDTIARLGGDEFVAVLHNLKAHEECIPMLKRLLSAASKVIEIRKFKMQVSASLGVSFFDYQDTTDADQLLRFADQAMYQAKLAGKNRFHIFDSIHDANVRTQHENMEMIDNAIRNDEFILYYQPKVNMNTGSIVGVEALIRWNHKTRGILAPGKFLPIIEGCSLSIEIGKLVLTKAFEQITLWKEKGLELIVSVNIDAMHLLNGNIVEYLKHLLNYFPKVKAYDIVLEILETSALEDIQEVSKIMQECQELGIAFSLDDFGTGYSSLTYLKRLPASELKIDQSFVREMLHDPDDLAIIEGVISLASAFHRHIIAEGVESIKHGQVLLQLGCEVAQGYIIARPMPAENMIEWIKGWKPHVEWSNVTPISRDNLPLLYATVEHKSWINNVLSFINNAFIGYLEENHMQCKFGKWLYTAGEKKYGNKARFTSIRTIHFEIHQYANKLISMKKSDIVIVEKDIEMLKILSQELVNILEEFLID